MRKGQHLIKSVKKRISQKLKGRHSSVSTEFKAGQIPWNKGMKGIYRSESSTKYKKRHKPHNWKPVGTISIRCDHRKEPVKFIKIAEPKKWEYYSRYIWIKTRKREIPKGFIIYHQDGNSLNDNPDNLICVPRSIHIIWLGIDIKNFKKKARESASLALIKRWVELRGNNP